MAETVSLPIALIQALPDTTLSTLFYEAICLAVEDSPAEYDVTLKAFAREIVARGATTYTDETLADALDMLDGEA